MLKKLLSAMTMVLALGTVTPAVVHAAPAPASFMIAKTNSAAKAAKVIANSKNTKRGKLDINTATLRELSSLPGVGKATAAKIIAGRPYKGKDELVKRNIVSAGQYAKIRDLIVAAQTPGKSTGKMSGKTNKNNKKGHK